MQGWVVVAAAVLYLGFLFLVATYGDRAAQKGAWLRGRPLIYALSLCVYCTSWTFFGSVGLASVQGLDFLTIYIGAGLMIGAGYPLLLHVTRLAKRHNITSIADFMAARYGKSPAVAATVTIIALIGVVPYIALQLKAVSASVGTMAGYISTPDYFSGPPVIADISLLVAIALAMFAILFGTRHADATEHQHGMMLAVATESIVKILAFLVGGLFVTYGMFDGIGDIWERATATQVIAPLFTRTLEGGTWITMLFLSATCILLLPRQFHVAVVENNSPREIRLAAWVFPLYLIIINIFVVPIAIAGTLTFGTGVVDADMFVLALPMLANANAVTLAVFIGGLSAATAMVIVASVALAIMVCNDLVVPMLLRRRGMLMANSGDIPRMLLNIRRIAILAILLLGFAYYRLVGNTAALASIGLLSFAAIAQLAPAFFIGLIWRRATARGALAGMICGFAVWAYTLLLPNFAASGLIDPTFLNEGPMGIAFLRPQTLFNIDFAPLPHGVFWSLLVNVLALSIVSLLSSQSPVERLQANNFVPLDLTPLPQTRRYPGARVKIEEVQDTVGRYIGHDRAARAFESYAQDHNLDLKDTSVEADIGLLRHAEFLLASSIGAASARLVLSLLLQRHVVGDVEAMRLLDDASTALQYNRDIMQSALDNVRHGIAVYDENLSLIMWNRQLRAILDLPADMGRIGITLADMIRYMAERGDFGEGDPVRISDTRVELVINSKDRLHERLADGRVLEFSTDIMPGGGFVIAVTDITESVDAAEALARSNETLERRVAERTAELTRLNTELEKAKSDAEEANFGKTRFLAAASHDLLQPLNAARLYAASLAEIRLAEPADGLTRNIDASLNAVEDILGAILDISRLDAGRMKPELTVFNLNDVITQLGVEFGPLARERGIELRLVPCNLTVRSDRRLLSRMMQNLVSNAIKYTRRGRVLVGCRRSGSRVRINVVDTGPGIPASKQRIIFREFQRLDEGSAQAKGLGLGLSIVERVGKVLKHPVTVNSKVGHGSVFSVEIPLSNVAALPSTDAAPPPSPLARLAGRRVLCVDNEDRILEGMRSLLGAWECEVMTAPGISAANRLLRENRQPPDIILMDYHLDGANGLDAITDLRWKFGPDIPAILITADRTPAIRQAARERDIAVLNKPVRPAALRALMSQQLRTPVSAAG
ncbi:MAG: hybrid sensor histidine kinase/response regulator [Rhodobiaceae bacterium]|nr:hybrid sensor histidine kinase/response regulator [Rhodobiaceae bacterium]MCC0055061.1 hybrid sensor histidine kinase/response regulator [Rhodobiaceae bacterium]